MKATACILKAGATRKLLILQWNEIRRLARNSEIAPITHS